MLEYDSPWQIAVRKAFPLLSYVGILISPHNSMNQRHRERGFEGFGPIPLSNQDLIIASYQGSLNTKPFQV